MKDKKKKRKIPNGPSVRIQLKGKKLGDPLEEFTDIVNTDLLKNDELFQECKQHAIQIYNQDVVMPLALKGQKFPPGNERMDKLSKLMFREFKILKERKSKPSAKELWEKIKDGHEAHHKDFRCIQEFVEDDDAKERVYFDGGETTGTSFHDFEKRLTRIRKKINK